MKGINRRGQSLVEFAVIALVLYMLLAAILTFGHLLYVAQGLQSAADLAARELSRTPLPAMMTFEQAMQEPVVRERIYDPDLLVVDLDAIAGQDFFPDIVPNWPVLNQQLATMMIVDRPMINGVRRNLLRYPGAVLENTGGTSEFTVGIPLITDGTEDGYETIRWVPVVEEIRSRNEDSENDPAPFSIDSAQRGIVALRINYPFQSASMSSFRPNPDGPFEPTLGQPNAADDDAVTASNAAPGDLLDAPLLSGDTYAGTYGGRYGLGAQGALGSEQMTGGRPVRPYRRVLSAQAIYRREIFSQ